MLKTFIPTVLLRSLIVLVLLISGSAWGQVSWSKQTLKRGKLWSTIWNSFQYGDPTEPVNAYHTLDYPGYSKGTDIADVLNYAGAGGYAIYGVRNGSEYAYTLDSRYFPSGQDVYAKQEALLTKNYNLADPNLLGEEIVTGAHYIYGLDLMFGASVAFGAIRTMMILSSTK